MQNKIEILWENQLVYKKEFSIMIDIDIAKAIALGILGLFYSVRSLRIYVYTKSKLDFCGFFIGLLGIFIALLPA